LNREKPFSADSSNNLARTLPAQFKPTYSLAAYESHLRAVQSFQIEKEAV
jgi:hypothetical protein